MLRWFPEGNEYFLREDSDTMDRIADFVVKSQAWTSAERARDILPSLSQILQIDFQGDAGFFVYQRRYIDPGPPDIYYPWGTLSDSIEFLRSNLRSWTEASGTSAVPLNEWLDIDVLPPSWQSQCRSRQIAQLGIWVLSARGHRIGAMVIAKSSSDRSDDDRILSVCAIQVSLILELLVARRVAEQTSHRDHLTGLLNRRGFIAQLSLLTSKLHTEQHLIGVVDVNDFKLINDSIGHTAGDQILTRLAEKLMTFVSSNGLCGRWGGDEFVFILRTEASAEDVESQVTALYANFPCQVSIGCSQWNLAGDTWERCFSAADDRMYQNKNPDET